MVRKVGGTGDDFFVGTASYDFLFGGGGRDTLLGGAGSDFIVGGVDDLFGDEIDGGAGDDVLFYDGFFLLSRAAPNLGLTVDGVAFENVIGGEGNDIILGGAGKGGGGNDVIVGSGTGGTGNDILFNGGEGEGGADLLIFTQAGSGSVGFGAFEDGVKERIVIDGNFAGNIQILGMDRFMFLSSRM